MFLKIIRKNSNKKAVSTMLWDGLFIMQSCNQN